MPRRRKRAAEQKTKKGKDFLHQPRAPAATSRPAPALRHVPCWLQSSAPAQPAPAQETNKKKEGLLSFAFPCRNQQLGVQNFGESMLKKKKERGRIGMLEKGGSLPGYK
ncbi:hypothetical protein SLEP1_g30397 [Rubroshorea leprosula]|uniref:Uncharacterized protein n=1 Tax=Rubroshorea leprosula TaxID=152421 RepID=A0AAV5K6K6_9ROSI|nr:hypothetical protein SLEP1_g30397 [Rubroshorea leprosula]